VTLPPIFLHLPQERRHALHECMTHS
jgi:hypothetical protein